MRERGEREVRMEGCSEMQRLAVRLEEGGPKTEECGWPGKAGEGNGTFWPRPFRA